ncbi:MAG TPA: hypothetical protein VK192_07260 [Sphingomicrobium sp.]|nr:hypothetical protein [Sphingomicrobium sp.]
MFVGHYAASFLAKAEEPSAPLWSYFTAAQLLDIGWSAFIMVGVEKMRVDPALPGSVFDLYYMPWTHSLLGAVAWSIAGALFFRWLLRLPARAALFIGLVVFSHWILDLLVHRPDLLLWPGGPKVGFALWNAPVLEEAIEMGLLAACAAIWVPGHVRRGGTIWSAAGLLVLLAVMQSFVIAVPPHGGNIAIGLTVLGAYLVISLSAYFAERGTLSRLGNSERPATVP